MYNYWRIRQVFKNKIKPIFKFEGMSEQPKKYFDIK